MHTSLTFMKQKMLSIAHRSLLSPRVSISPPRVPRSHTCHGDARPAQKYCLCTSINDHDFIMPSFHSQCGFHTTSFMMSFIAAIAVVLLSNKNDDDEGGGGHGALVPQYVPIQHDHEK